LPSLTSSGEGEVKRREGPACEGKEVFAVRRPSRPYPKREGWLWAHCGYHWWYAWASEWLEEVEWRTCLVCGTEYGYSCEHMWEERVAKRPVFTGGITPEGTPEKWTMPAEWIGIPFVAEMICNPNWEDGSLKGGRSFAVYANPGSVVCSVKVEFPAIRLSTVGGSVQSALAGMELALASDPIPWLDDALKKKNGYKKS
jgi:hypothetical protein